MKFTIFLTAIMIAVFGYQIIYVPDIAAFFNTYGFSGKNMIDRPYTILTSIFVHGGLTHLLSNILVMLFFGMAVEKELGWRKMLAIFFLGAAAGDLLSLVAYPFDAVAVGASAGIFALIGAGILVKPFDLSFYPFIVPLPLAFVGISYALYNVYGFLFDAGSNISYAGHFGGFFVGLIFGFRRQGLGRSLKIIILSLIAVLLVPIILAFLRRLMK
ncbi:MAG: rhomboid family intramembrane serine protease [Candidatus Aenigmarchaeota archaeon]|nr:rhomboid family intramembrane serine protease [Candidatus Aenigmarchaeota archaeon]